MFVILAHGSSHAEHAVQVKALAEKVSALLGEEVKVAFLSDAMLPKGAIVLPLFLGEGRHMRKDVRALIEQAEATMLTTLAEHADGIATLLVQRLTQASKRIHVVFTLYQFIGFEEILTALYKQSKGCSLVAMATLHGSPNISSVLHALQQQGVKKLVLQPVLMFDGHSLDACREAAKAVGMDVEMQPALANIDAMSVWVAAQFQQGKICQQ